MTEDEARLAELVAYHTGLFTGQVAVVDADRAWIAHALWALAREAEKQRERWLSGANRLGTAFIGRNP